MTNRLFNKLLLIFGLLFISTQLNAASTTTTISANVVPRAALFMTGSILLGSETITEDESQTKANGIHIISTSFNSKNTAKIKINTSHNAAYDISISPSSTLRSDATKKIEMKTARTYNGFESANNKEQDLMIEAEVSDVDKQDVGLYIGTVEINVNYN